METGINGKVFWNLNETIEYEEKSALIVTELCEYLDCEPLEVVDRVKQIKTSAVSPLIQKKVNTLHTVVSDAVQEIDSIVDNHLSE